LFAVNNNLLESASLL